MFNYLRILKTFLATVIIAACTFLIIKSNFFFQHNARIDKSYSEKSTIHNVLNLINSGRQAEAYSNLINSAELLPEEIIGYIKNPLSAAAGKNLSKALENPGLIQQLCIDSLNTEIIRKYFADHELPFNSYQMFSIVHLSTRLLYRSVMTQDKASTRELSKKIEIINKIIALYEKESFNNNLSAPVYFATAACIKLELLLRSSLTDKFYFIRNYDFKTDDIVVLINTFNAYQNDPLYNDLIGPSGSLQSHVYWMKRLENLCNDMRDNISNEVRKDKIKDLLGTVPETSLYF